jgi:curved DNA-binding protein CbpA
MDLAPQEEKFVSRLVGDLTLREILDLGMDKQWVYHIVYALRVSGMITFHKDKLPQAEVIPPEPPAVETPPPPSGRSRAAVVTQPSPPPRPERARGRLTKHGGVPVPKLRASDERQQESLTPEEHSQREQLARQLVEIKKKNHFEMLGVSRNASIAEVKKAYFSLAKQYHPDRLYANASPEVRNLAEELFGLISVAHDVLADSSSRQEYLDSLSSGAKKPVSSEVSKILTAEGLFQKGEMELHKRDYDQAQGYFGQAVQLCPDEGEFHAFLGWAMFQADPKSSDNVRRSRDEINQAIALNPKVDKAYLFLGYIYKAMGYREMAEHEFEKAIQCNPDCTEALRELRLINMRRKRKPKKSKRS